LLSASSEGDLQVRYYNIERRNEMNITIMDVTVVVLWITLMDIAALVNVFSWVVIKWLVKMAREM